MATNIAETSITIDDVVYVIDSGRVKETQVTMGKSFLLLTPPQYDSTNNMTCLVDTWISRASAKQRRGRAGRVRPGKCFKLFTKSYHDETMLAQQVSVKALHTLAHIHGRSLKFFGYPLNSCACASKLWTQPSFQLLLLAYWIHLRP